MHRKKIILIFFLLFLNISCIRGKTAECEIRGKTVKIEIADTEEARNKGLSDRRFIGKNQGMLFVFSDVNRRSFWMKHCFFDIDIAYIDFNGRIDEIITMQREPYDSAAEKLKQYISKSWSIKYALEMPGGWFNKNSVQAGDILTWTVLYNTSR